MAIDIANLSDSDFLFELAFKLDRKSQKPSKNEKKKDLMCKNIMWNAWLKQMLDADAHKTDKLAAKTYTIRW